MRKLPDKEKHNAWLAEKEKQSGVPPGTFKRAAATPARPASGRSVWNKEERDWEARQEASAKAEATAEAKAADRAKREAGARAAARAIAADLLKGPEFTKDFEDAPRRKEANRRRDKRFPTLEGCSAASGR
jgi:hypothetical protein